MAIFTNKGLANEMSAVSGVTTPFYQEFNNYVKNYKKLNKDVSVKTVNNLFNTLSKLYKSEPLGSLSKAYISDKALYILPLIVNNKHRGFIRVKYYGNILREITVYLGGSNSKSIALKQQGNGGVKIEHENYQRILGLTEVEDKWANYLDKKHIA